MSQIFLRRWRRRLVCASFAELTTHEESLSSATTVGRRTEQAESRVMGTAGDDPASLLEGEAVGFLVRGRGSQLGRCGAESKVQLAGDDIAIYGITARSMPNLVFCLCTFYEGFEYMCLSETGFYDLFISIILTQTSPATLWSLRLCVTRWFFPLNKIFMLQLQ